MSGRHGTPLRGLMSVKSSTLHEGFFGRMFPRLHAAKFGSTDIEAKAKLKLLADAMSADFDKPFDGVDPEESGIPALYTYFGQFIDHDITFDPTSTLQRQQDPDALIDFRTPSFDLDNVYGRGPDDQPYMYETDKTFLLGSVIHGGVDAHARDLPRSPNGRALIGDPRNDENTIVSQLQGLFLRFHNRFVADNPTLTFAEVQQQVRFHYQYVVLNDFLPRIVHDSVLSKLKDASGRYDARKLEFYHFKNLPFMPVEFSVAAYRLGHSIIRPGYRLNDNVLLPIFPVPKEGFPEGLTGFRPMIPSWGIDWGRFIDLDIRPTDAPGDVNKRLQFAYRLDTSTVNPLKNLPPSVAPDIASLPQRNLERGWALKLPSGQHVAHAMGLTPLKDDEILIGKFTGVQADTDALKPIVKIDAVFAKNAPLWTYILAETRTHQVDVKLPVTENKTIKMPQLGPVGGRIVAEVFLGMMFGDASSILRQHPLWTPAGGPHYALKDLVKYALGL